MRQSIIAKTLAIAAIIALAVALAPRADAADKGCSNTSIKGTFAFRGTGSVFDPAATVLLSVLFAQTFDGNGGLTATGFQSHNGNILQVTQTGSYTVNPDCTGTYTAMVFPMGLTVHFFFVVTDSGNELQVLSTDPHTLISGPARRLFPGRDI